MPAKRKDDETVEVLRRFCAWVAGLNESSKLNESYFRIYRGLRNKSYDVSSTAYRKVNRSRKDLVSSQEDLIQDAKAHGYGKEKCDLEILAELQHQGAATCLIDFTMDPFIALWFACHESKGTDGKVIVMNAGDTYDFREVSTTRMKNPIVTFFEEEEYQPDILWKWRPTSVHVNRVLAQKSIFVFGKYKITREDIINSFEVPKACKEKLSASLDKIFGLNEKNIFYDFAGFAEAHGPDKLRQGTADNALRNGIEAHQNEEYEKAIEYYTQAIHRGFKKHMAYTYRGYAKADIKKHKEAIKDYTKAIELDDKYAKAYNALGLSRAALGKHKEAIRDYTKAIDFNPKYAAAYNNCGISKETLKDYEEAIECYDKAIEHDSQFAGAHNNRGAANARLGEHEEAIKNYKKAIELNPRSAKAYYNLGNAKKKLEEYEVAIEYYDAAIERDSKYAKAYSSRGNLREYLGNMWGARSDFKNACRLYTKFIERNPKDTIACEKFRSSKKKLIEINSKLDEIDESK